jgi:phosphatidate cytidylyltransferase
LKICGQQAPKGEFARSRFEIPMNNGTGAPGNGPPRFGVLQTGGLGDLVPRALSAIVLIVAALVSLWLGGIAFALIWLCAALAVGWEWQNLIRAPRLGFRVLAAVCSLILWQLLAAGGFVCAAWAVLCAGAAAAALAAGRGRRLWAFCGVAYAALLLVSVSVLHEPGVYGARAIVWLFAIVWGTDVFAYFGGRLIRGPKLWPKVSPSKTWSGTIAGVLAGAGLGTAIGGLGLGLMAQAPLFALGLAAAAVSQGGDILESWVKRRFGVKDSSRLIPGHGGFMDRFDGFIAAAGFAALASAARGHATLAAGLFEWPRG